MLQISCWATRPANIYTKNKSFRKYNYYLQIALLLKKLVAAGARGERAGVASHINRYSGSGKMCRLADSIGARIGLVVNL